MTSAEILTQGEGGYPQLLQTGGIYRGAQMHDRQHPNSLIMELAARHTAALTRNLTYAIYAGGVSGGARIHDAQHPNSLIMELAARHRAALTRTLTYAISAGAVGEPALG